MSVAKDDISVSRSLETLQAEFVKPDKKENSEKVSGQESNRPEFNDVYEHKKTFTEKDLEKLQEEYNELEQKSKDLTDVDKDLAQINLAEESPEELEKKIQELDKVVEQAAPEPPKVEQKLPELPTTPEENSAQKVNELRAKVNEKQQQIDELKRELNREVSSRVELKIGSNSSGESVEEWAENTKNSVIQGINENPEQARKVQITNLDSNLLLAMVSLRK